MCSIASHITTNIPFACYQLYAFGRLGAASPAEGRFGRAKGGPLAAKQQRAAGLEAACRAAGRRAPASILTSHLHFSYGMWLVVLWCADGKWRWDASWLSIAWRRGLFPMSRSLRQPSAR